MPFVESTGSWFMVYGLWFMVYGLWFMVYGLWFMVYGLWFMVYGLWFSGQGFRFKGFSCDVCAPAELALHSLDEGMCGLQVTCDV